MGLSKLMASTISRKASFSSTTTTSSSTTEDEWSDAKEDFLPATPLPRQRERTVRGDPLTGKMLGQADIIIERPRSRASSRRSRRSSISSIGSIESEVTSSPRVNLPDLDMLDIDELLAAVSGPPPSWPSPPACLGLAPPWAPAEPGSSSSPRDYGSSYLEALDFDPERTPRPPQGCDATPRPTSAYDVDSPPLEAVEFPSPPERKRGGRPRDSFFLAPEEEGEREVASSDEDEMQDAVSSLESSPVKSSPGSRRSSRSTGSQNGSQQSFRWSSGTTSTVLTYPSNRLSGSECDRIKEEEDSVEERATDAFGVPYFQAYPLRRATLRRTESDPAAACSGSSSASSSSMGRTASEPVSSVGRTLAALRPDEAEIEARRLSGVDFGETSEWADLIDTLFAPPPQPAPLPSRPPSTKSTSSTPRPAVTFTTVPRRPSPSQRDSLSPPSSIRSTPRLKKKSSVASIASSYPVPPTILVRTTSLSPNSKRRPRDGAASLRSAASAELLARA